MKAYLIATFFVIVSFAGFLSGCNDSTFPVAVVNEPDVIADPSLVYLEASSIYPASASPGEEIVVRRGSGVFPVGFYRVTFSGGAMSEFFWPSSSSEVSIIVSPDAMSGPFGFTVGASPTTETYYNGPSASEFKAFAVKAPGLIVQTENSSSF